MAVGLQKAGMYLAQVHTIDKVHDLAILRTEVTSDDVDLLPRTEGAPGLQVYTIGYDDEHYTQEEPLISIGRIDDAGPFNAEENRIISEPRPYKGRTALAYVISGAPCSGGSSGGAVLDGSGRILGYIKGRLDDNRCIASL
ncbi:MAG: S1 family peptidase [bacterium]